MTPIEEYLQYSNDATVTRVSKVVNGPKIVETGKQGQNSVAMAQVGMTAAGQDYTVELQAAVSRQEGRPRFEPIATFTPDSGLFEFNLCMGAVYRFEITAGTLDTDVLVLLGA